MVIVEMRTRSFILCLACLLTVITGDLSAEIPTSAEEVAEVVGSPAAVQIEPEAVLLAEPRATRQLLVTGHYDDGSVRDLTRLCEFKIVDEARAAVTSEGLVSGVADGATTLTVRANDIRVEVPVRIENSQREQPISFRREFVPVLSAAGCSDIRCHGAPSGKDGFRLSLWGHDPDLDFRQLTRTGFGRRTNPLAPHDSLIMRKALGQAPHVGGRRFRQDSMFARLFAQWQAEGLHDDSAPIVLHEIEVTPRQRVLHAPARWQQLSAQASFEGGRVADVTRLTTFSSTDPAIASVDRSGLVEFHRQGEVAILCRYCGRMESIRLMHITSPPPGFRWPDPPENNFVDTHVFDKLRMLNLPPSDLSSDQQFVRRVYLDLCGILPTAAETRQFIAATDADKRARLVDRLLERPEYADYWTRKWLDVLRVSRDSIQLAGARAFRDWLRTRIAGDEPFDETVRELITSQGESYSNPAVNFYCVPRTPEKVTDALYLQKDLAEATAQLFLGIRLQCAQCHNHPYERWTQNDYLSLASFFTQISRSRLGEAGPKGRPDRRQMAISLDYSAAEITNAAGDGPATPGFPGEPSPEFDPEQDRRPILAAWLTDDENPFFARSFVNRVWYHLHGRGIVEPVDDFRDSNPSANDGLLDALAADFVAGGYRLKPLIATIVNSRTYQLSSLPNEFNRNDDRYFSHMVARPLPAEVLLDAVSTVTGVPEQFEVMDDYITGIPTEKVQFPEGTRAVELPVNDVATLINTEGRYVRYELHPFLRVFGQPNGTETCECARESTFGRKQALELLVGQLVSEKVRNPENVLSATGPAGESDAERLNELYLSALSREPSSETAATYLDHISQSEDKRGAWEDILWAVLNAQEFIYQH